MTDLAERIRDHYDSMVEPVTADEILGTARFDAVPALAPKRRPVRAVALVAATVAVVGLAVALLINRDGGPSPVVTPTGTGEPPPVLGPGPTPDPPVTSESQSDGPSEGAAGGSGDGPQLALSEVPLGEASRDAYEQFPAEGGVWFDGALYALGSRADGAEPSVESVLRTPDGLAWESVVALDELRQAQWTKLVASDDLLIAAGEPADGRLFGEPGAEDWGTCGTDAGTDLAASDDGQTWTVSRLDAPGLDALFELGGCVKRDTHEVAIGTGRALVVNRFETRFDEHTYSARLLAELQPELRFSSAWRVADESTRGEAVLDVDGRRLTIPFDDEAFADAQRRYDEFVTSEIGPTGRRTFAWTSPDGVTWTPVEPTGPLAEGAVDDLVGTSHGFYLRRLWPITVEHTPDLVSWETVATIGDLPTDRWGEFGPRKWGDRIVLMPSGRAFGTDEILFPDHVVHMAEHFGELGAFGVGCLAEVEAGCEDSAVFFYSDGDSWSAWRPTELDALGEIEQPRVIGAGADFVLLQVTPAEDPRAGEPLLFVARLP